MIFHSEDQIVVDVQLHLRVDETDATGQAWLSLLLNFHTLFSLLVIIILAKLDVLRSWSIRSVEVKIQVGTKQGKTEFQF